MGRRSVPWRAAGYWLAVYAAIFAVGMAVFVLSGIYNVAASVNHFPVVTRLIQVVIDRSVDTRSLGMEVPDLEDEDLIRLGANHYRFGCAICHGSPSEARNPVMTSMYPAPPMLDHAVREWKPRELGWIVRHGLKYSGMPAWPGAGRDDEVWSVVAFIRRLPGMSGAQYQALVGPGLAVARSEPDLGFGQAGDGGLAMCVACHGDRDSRPINDLVPILHDQKADYLMRALIEYRQDRRQSGIMEPVAAALPADALGELVRYYAAADRPPPEPGAEPGAESVLRGRAIAEEGVPEDQIPPCLSCHSPDSSGQFPVLAGLSQAYLARQLELWQAGLRDQSGFGAIMASIAPRLSPAQIRDVTAYFASLSGAGSDRRGAP